MQFHYFLPIVYLFPIVCGLIRGSVSKVTYSEQGGSIRNSHSSHTKEIDQIDNTLTTASHDEPIVIDIGYNEFWKRSASWSYKTSHSDYDSKYFLIDYTQYDADSFKNFSKRYPTVTIETQGKAISDSTFGDVGRNKFGSLMYNTNFFIADDDRYYVYLVKTSTYKFFTYNVGVKIGIGFGSLDSKLFLYPFVDGYLVSHGSYKRSLEFGLEVLRLTFNPKKV